jgi:hypothetical protein
METAAGATCRQDCRFFESFQSHGGPPHAGKGFIRLMRFCCRAFAGRSGNLRRHLHRTVALSVGFATLPGTNYASAQVVQTLIGRSSAARPTSRATDQCAVPRAANQRRTGPEDGGACINSWLVVDRTNRLDVTDADCASWDPVHTSRGFALRMQARQCRSTTRRRQIVYSETGRGVHTAIVDGNIVVENRCITTVDYSALVNEALLSALNNARQTWIKSG